MKRPRVPARPGRDALVDRQRRRFDRERLARQNRRILADWAEALSALSAPVILHDPEFDYADRKPWWRLRRDR